MRAALLELRLTGSDQRLQDAIREELAVAGRPARQGRPRRLQAWGATANVARCRANQRAAVAEEDPANAPAESAKAVAEPSLAIPALTLN